MRRLPAVCLVGTVVVGLALSCVPQTSRLPPARPPAPLTMSDEAWVQSTLAEMTLEQRVGQMLMLPLPGSFENLRGPAMRDLERLMLQVAAGGFLVETGAPLDVALKLNALQSRSRLPLFFAAEMEWGAGMRLRSADLPDGTESDGGTVFPFNMGIAATHDPFMAELAGRVTAVEARAVGIHWLFAPVVDINTAPDNPFVNIRSYSSDPSTVATYARAFIRGATAGGALTAAKHFPGHGDTRVGSNLALPVVNVDTAVLFARELLPFRAAVAAGVSAVLVGHIAVPALTGGLANPATLAPQIGRDMLRQQLAFDGIVVTDAMGMGALRHIVGYSPGELVVRAVEAGADIVLAPPDPLLAHSSLLTAVRSGRLHYSRVDSSVTRILRAKASLGLHRSRTVPLDSVARIVGAPEHQIVAANIAARSLTLARDSAGLLPLDPRRIRDLAVVAFTTRDDIGAGAALSAELERIYGRGVTFFRIDPSSSDALIDSAVLRAARSDATIFAMFLMPPSGDGTLNVPAPARRLAARLEAASRRMVVVSFGEPYGPATLPGASTFLLAWQPRGNAAQRAAAGGIAGRLPLPGRLPVQLPRNPPGGSLERPVFEYGLEFAQPEDVGMDGVLLDRVDSIISAHLVVGAAPGAAVAIGRHGRMVKLRGYGTVDRRRGFPEVTDSTIYDMASLTKVVATTTALMMLYDEGAIRLDDPVGKHLPEWRGSAWKDAVTIRHLLLHTSGLAAYSSLWRDLQGREAFRRRITGMSLEYEPGTRTLYSDFGIILLGFIVEQVSGRTLDVFLRDRLFRPLNMRDTGFNPLSWPYGTALMDGESEQSRAAPEPILQRIAPTEVDTIFRHRHIRGQVHDENAFALGGVAAHAGLFSSARDMAIFAQLMLNRGFFGGQRFFDPATVATFTARQSMGGSRALGWDTPEGASSAGSYFSPASYGHTGFTGTSIWIDPERDVFVVLLTNRVNPTRDNQRHVALRRDVADAVQTSIIDMPMAGQ
jgi:beta-N-acetylhexosaminidase